MKIVLEGEYAILLSPTEGMLTIEADSPSQTYSPFHMLGSALATCTFSVLYSWVMNSSANFSVDDLQIRVSWEFAENPHRVGHMNMELHWPSLPQERRAAAQRAAQLCAVHATLSHTVPITRHAVAHGAHYHGAEVMTVPVVTFVHAGEAQQHDCGARPYTVVYDGACNVCSRLARVLEKWDKGGQLSIVPSQAPGVKACFPWIPDAAYRESLQLIGPGGRTWQGAQAIEELLNVLPRGRAISWIFKMPLVRGIADRLYRWFARNRYKLGCGEHCQVKPTRVEF